MLYGSCSSSERDLESASRTLNQCINNFRHEDKTLVNNLKNNEIDQWTANQITEIVLESLKERVSTKNICSQHGISEVILSQWRQKFIEGGLHALKDLIPEKPVG